MENKPMKKPLSKNAMVIIYSTVFILVGMIFTDVTTHKHYLPNILITLGLGWVFMVLLSKNSIKKPLVLGPEQGKEYEYRIPFTLDELSNESKKIETGTMFCFKCQTIHDSNSVCSFETPITCNHSRVTDCQTDETFVLNVEKL